MDEKLENIKNEVIEAIDVFPDKKYKIKCDLITITSKITDLKQELKNLEASFYLMACKNTELKTEAMRNAAVTRKAATEDVYQKYSKDLRLHEEQKSEMDAELSRIRAKITLYKILSEMIKE